MYLSWRIRNLNVLEQLFPSEMNRSGDRTPLLQIYDTGLLEGPSGSFEVREAQIYGGYVLHIGSITSGGKMSVGDKVFSKVLMKRCASAYSLII